jgi:hypothetical protein
LEARPGTEKIIRSGKVVMNKPVANVLELTEAIRQRLHEFRRTVDAQWIETWSCTLLASAENRSINDWICV